MIALCRVVLTALLLVVFALDPARAQVLIRDAEIERALREIAKPIVNAAGLNAGGIRIMVIQDRTLNAFVVDHKSVFIHSGLLLRLKTPEEVQAVIAHEVAHIANGHITRRGINSRNAQTAAGLGAVLGVLAIAAGGGAAGAGIIAGSAESAKRVFFGHTRAEEAAADQSGIRYMASAGVDPQAAVKVMQLFRGQEALNVGRQDPYVRTHPLTSERLRALKGYAAAYRPQTNVRGETNTKYWYARLQMKLAAFTQAPRATLRRIGRTDTSEIALLGKAIAYHKQPDPKKAVSTMKQLLAKRPNDPYYNELYGQILLESRNFNAAVSAYKRAVDLAPNQSLILSGYGRAILATGKTKQALPILERARARDGRNPRLLRALATAYGQLGKTGRAALAAAERHAVLGRLEDAAIAAKRAQGLLPRGSSGWLRAQDIISAAEKVKKQRG